MRTTWRRPGRVSPDAGRVKVAERYANGSAPTWPSSHKRHVAGQKNAVEARGGDRQGRGRTCVLIDDMIDTAGTIVRRRRPAHRTGPTTSTPLATHGVLSGPAIDRLKNSMIEKVVVTNTLPLPPEKQFDKIEVLSVARSSPMPSTRSSRTPP